MKINVHSRSNRNQRTIGKNSVVQSHSYDYEIISNWENKPSSIRIDLFDYEIVGNDRINRHATISIPIAEFEKLALELIKRNLILKNMRTMSRELLELSESLRVLTGTRKPKVNNKKVTKKATQ